MPSWRRVITSGSDATLNSLYVKTGITGSSFTGSFKGFGVGLIGIVSSSYAVTASYALNAPPIGGNTYYFNVTYRDQSGGTLDTYGSLTGSINNTNTFFKVSQGYYLSGTLKVWLNGQLQTQGTAEDWFEGIPGNGTFYFVSSSIPILGDTITVEYHRSINNSGSFLSNIVEDTSPTLGGNLDGNGFSISNAAFSGNGSGITGIISSSYAVTASYALNGGAGGPVAWDDITGKPTVVSSSIQLATEISGAFFAPSSSFSSRISTLETQYQYSGSFSGSFQGDGSGITGLTKTIGLTIDGGGSAITTGIKSDIIVPFNCNITGWYVTADQVGSIVIDVWKDTFANFPPTVADTITGTEKPTLSGVNKNSDTNLTTWTTSVTSGDVLRFNVDSVSTVTKINLTLTANLV